MNKASAFLKNNPLVWVMYAVLLVCLFLGDGKQTIIDVVGLGLVIVLFIVSRIFLPKQQEIPTTTGVAWAAFLIYLVVRTAFSDDTGFSVFVTLRYFDTFLIYYIFSCYTTNKTVVVYTRFLLGFCVAALISAVAVSALPILSVNLPLMSLLYATYGHNHVVDVLLTGFPLGLLLWFQTKKTRYLLLMMLFFVGTALSFARAAMLVEAVMLNAAILYTQISNKTLQWRMYFVGLIFAAIAITGLFFPYQAIQINQTFLPKQTKQLNFTASRLEFIKQGVQGIHEKPIFGFGPGTFTLVSQRFQSTPGQSSWYAHNYVMETVVELGFFGFLLFAFVVFATLKQTHIKKALLVVAGTIFVYGLIDYSMNYLVVWFLLWSSLGLVFNNSSHKSEKASNHTPVIVWIALAVSVFGYVALFSAFVIDWSAAKLLLVGKAKQEIQQNGSLIQYVRAVHKFNPEILSALSYSAFTSDLMEKENLLLTATTLNPQNTELYNQEFQRFADSGKYRQIWKELQRLSCLINPGTICTKITSIVLTPELENSVKQVFDSKTNKKRNDYSAIFYYIGYYSLPVNIETSRELWEIATLIRPDTGHYFIEWASIEKYIYTNEERVKQILQQCQTNISPKKECQFYFGKNLPEPGWYFETIANYQ